MIKVRFNIDQEGEIVGFDVRSHGDKLVCAAISALAINAINSIEWLADTEVSYEYENERFINFRLTDKPDTSATLLLESLRMGVRSVAEEHPEEVSVEETTVSVDWI